MRLLAAAHGLILPPCQSGSGTCTLREAVIITSVLQRASIPVLHPAAAQPQATDSTAS